MIFHQGYGPSFYYPFSSCCYSHYPPRFTAPRHTCNRKDTFDMYTFYSDNYFETELAKKAELTSLSQCCSHLVLSGVDVASRPAALSPQGTECLNQHLRRYMGRQGEKEEGQVGAAHKRTTPSNSAGLRLHWEVDRGYGPAR